MVLTGIWIKAIALIIMAILVLVCGFYSYKKLNWKGYELAFVLIVGFILIVMGAKNLGYIANPHVESVSVKYIYQSGMGVVFGREYHFEDDNGNNYDLTMDPITIRKIFKNKEFKSDTDYIITYEKKSETIIAIEEPTNQDQSGDGNLK